MNVKAAECGSFTPPSFEVDRAAEAASRPTQRPLPSPFFFHHTLSRRGILGAAWFSAAENEVYQL
jgi:hypothetical protein